MLKHNETEEQGEKSLNDPVISVKQQNAPKVCEH